MHILLCLLAKTVGSHLDSLLSVNRNIASWSLTKSSISSIFFNVKAWCYSETEKCPGIGISIS
jgi:hypothetical protein